ncbi:hypothetical protein GH714_010694 [Hevea brasiliensis]|uniref:Longin domain-containing protein n=1 Tax=Hevea brasiliensis TaxID=3981 RepID=A0A6A6MD66_HEVBR|nr:hypothetical protein GH714_010694 [Hevea brasiliensis]
MGQQSLIYSFVSCGNVILAEYTEFSGNFNSIAFQCLRKLPATNNKFTDNCDAHSFNYLVDNGYTMGRGRKRQLPELTLDVSTELPETTAIPLSVVDPRRDKEAAMFCHRERSNLRKIRALQCNQEHYSWTC